MSKFSDSERARVRTAIRVLFMNETQGAYFIDHSELGYDPYTFSTFGHPSWDDVRLKAKDILLEAICRE